MLLLLTVTHAAEPACCSYGTPGRLPLRAGLVRKPFNDTQLFTTNGFPSKARLGCPVCRLRSHSSCMQAAWSCHTRLTPRLQRWVVIMDPSLSWPWHHATMAP
jgi:hypothetical protein